MSYFTPRRLATGLGTAHGGTHHWWLQRLSSVALIILTPLFAVPFAQALGEGHAAVTALYAVPFHALVAILFVAVAFHHLAQGLQVVIEDYVHHKGWRTGLLIANTFVCAAFGIAGVFAVLKLALAG